MECPHSIRKEGSVRAAILNCEECNGSSSLLDRECRKNIFKILRKEIGINRLILNHPFVKVFDGSSLNFLNDLALFIEAIQSFDVSAIPSKGKGCDSCMEKRIGRLQKIKEISLEDPIDAFQKLREEMGRKKPRIVGTGENKCDSCNEKYRQMISELLQKGELSRKIIGKRDSSFYYTYKIQPYVRPIFFDTYIHLSPPADAVFIKKYEVKRKGGRPLSVSLYSLATRPEKFYFIIPPEYNLPIEELQLLQKVKEKLARHRPKDASFMDPLTSREYFLKFGKETIHEIASEENISLDVKKLEQLADIFAKYTAGLGILEDLLLDKNIQDIYINAPVENNPLHIIWQGEEYTSNIYFSEGDVEAISSRLRSLSGRPFSEGAPILDMGLEAYEARVAAIQKPLTPKGVAFAIRRHSSQPWTLPKFIENKMLSPMAAGLLSFLVDGQASMLIAGSRGSGKTSLLSALMLEIPQRYRILTLEDTPELPIDKLQSLGYKIQPLITKPITAGDGVGVDPKTALRTALRLGESVLVLGEVRGEETKVLFEAMRVGAAGNLILGTIHGATTRDVFERIVYDIGVAPTSFKATDVVVVAAPIRIGGGMEKKRRVLQISEIVKTGWGKDVDPDKIFADIMQYDASQDKLIATDLLDMGQSEIIGRIAREWGIDIERAIENISIRARIRKKMVDYGKKNSELLEAQAVRDANNAFWMFVEESRREDGFPNYEKIEKKWMEWFSNYARIK